MNQSLLNKHLTTFIGKTKKQPVKYEQEFKERLHHTAFYKSYTKEKILSMTEEDIYEYLSPLWAMLIWGNKHYIIDKIIDENNLPHLRKQLANLVWGKDNITSRWDDFRKNIKGIGPAMISEILCKTHPEEFMIWNRRAYVGLNYLDVESLPKYDYQLTGKVYKHICDESKIIASALLKGGFFDGSLLSVNYFIWDELQVEENLTKIHTKTEKKQAEIVIDSPESSLFIHNDVRDKLKDIGEWLGFSSKIEQKVAEGSKIDTIWEATIGNMGRVIYVFEVQTRGSIDSLIINLLKSLNNPAVQGVVAVSDKEQLEKIKRHADGVNGLKDKLKFWDFEEVLKIHQDLEFVNSSINKLGLVPQGF